MKKTLSGSLKNKKILITSGPTWVAVDEVRVISNRSSGQLGRQIAGQLAQAGARVTVLEGPVTDRQIVKSIKVIPFYFFNDLQNLLRGELKKNYDVVIHAAAVADFRLQKIYKGKLGSNQKGITLRLVPTVKLIDQIKKISPKSFLMGFKLETAKSTAALVHSAGKLFDQAGCDLVVANRVAPGYEGYILDPSQKILARASSRREMAKKIVTLLKSAFS